MNNLHALIIDDEAPAIEVIRQLLQDHPSIEVTDTCSDGRSAIELIRRVQPDLIFLDIQMPEFSGFEVLRAIPESSMPYVIFTTAFDQYAIQAFEINAIDYLLKPIAEDRFRLSVQRATEAYNNRSARQWNRKMKALLRETPTNAPANHVKKLAVKVGSRIKFIPVEEVIWISAENQYVRIHLTGQSYLLRQSLNKLEAILSPDDFYRTHRSSIVNIHAIQQVEPYFKGDYLIYLKNGSKAKLSRSRAEGLRQILPW